MPCAAFMPPSPSSTTPAYGCASGRVNAHPVSPDRVAVTSDDRLGLLALRQMTHETGAGPRGPDLVVGDRRDRRAEQVGVLEEHFGHREAREPDTPEIVAATADTRLEAQALRSRRPRSARGPP